MERGCSLPGMLLAPINLSKWFQEHEKELEPPVGAALLHRSEEFFVMVVKGPNQRNDYHINPGNEWFYQLKGTLILRVIDDVNSTSPIFREIIVNEGEAFMLPSDVPHCPVRIAGSIGLVLERIRKEGEMDTLCWYCEVCKERLYETSVHCADHQLGAIFTPLIEAYYANERLYTCKKCHTINSIPKI
jgi:3-hydroxyanthranilate 3,4-dioxygenase